jgi:hypothetical protein
LIAPDGASPQELGQRFLAERGSQLVGELAVNEDEQHPGDGL